MALDYQLISFTAFSYSSDLHLCFARPECLLSHCIVGPALVLDPALPSNVSVKELSSKSGALSSSKRLLQVAKPLQPSSSVSVLFFHSQSDGEKHASVPNKRTLTCHGVKSRVGSNKKVLALGLWDHQEQLIS